MAGLRAISVLEPHDIVAEADRLGQRQPHLLRAIRAAWLTRDCPTHRRRLVLAVRALNRIDDGEDPDAVIAEAMPMFESTDGSLS